MNANGNYWLNNLLFGGKYVINIYTDLLEILKAEWENHSKL